MYNAENKRKTSTVKTTRSAIKTYVCVLIRNVERKALFVKENTVKSHSVLPVEEINNAVQPKDAPMMDCAFVVD